LRREKETQRESDREELEFARMSTRVALAAAAAAAAAAGDDLRRGAWTAEEDEKLLAYVGSHGTGHWRSVGRKAGANASCFYSLALLQ
jgi:hypothetical protein